VFSAGNTRIGVCFVKGCGGTEGSVCILGIFYSVARF